MCNKLVLIFLLVLAYTSFSCQNSSIDREALVSRHNVSVQSFDTLSTLSIGNGKFAYSVDFTGLQSYPEIYQNGIPLGTQSEWGWHSFPNEEGYRFEETFVDYEIYGRKVAFAEQVKEPERARKASDYFRSNPHRLHLGTVGLKIVDAGGTEVLPENIKNIDQILDLWKGEIRSTFTVNSEPVEVTTLCHPERDLISFRVRSGLISKGLLKVKISFPYPTGAHADAAADWNRPNLHRSILKTDPQGASIERKIDTTRYFTRIEWAHEAEISETSPHQFELSSTADEFEVSIEFSSGSLSDLPAFASVSKSNSGKWKKFWSSGGAIDFSGSTDPRAKELERRVILSQYLTAIQCAGNYPPQETGLTYNSWFGKFHLEMVWWHTVHYALWNRIEYIEKLMPWYEKVADEARHIAQRQGYDGVRWQKMTDPSGAETSSSIGSFLIWQQPHYIYLAELCYRQNQDMETLNKYKDLVFETADFMASYAEYEEENNRYVLGPALIPAQECFDAKTTINPPFELTYWYWGLATAIKWAERLNIAPNERWQNVMDGLSGLATTDGLYVPAESVPNAYKEHTHMHDHPMPLGAFGMMPGTALLDTTMTQNTFDFIWENWEWEDTWGWDFPMTAMTATRLNHPEKAVEAIFMGTETNTYLPNGHNYQDGRLRLYLPGNGGLLTAVAMMCAGYDGCTSENPGIPKDGTWQVKWEGLRKMP